VSRSSVREDTAPSGLRTPATMVAHWGEEIEDLNTVPAAF